jgi:hypothetical protein
MSAKPMRVLAAAAGSALILGAGAARAGPPFRTDDPEPVALGHWEIYGFSQATHVAGDTAGALPAVEVNYGAAPGVQIHALAPIAFDAPRGSGTKFGYGDTELGAKIRFIDEDENGWRPQVAIFPVVELPSGNEARGLGTGHTHAFLPLWIGKGFGKWLTYGGAGYGINPGAGNRNYWFVGWLVQRQVTDDLAVGGELFHQTADTEGGKAESGFNLGAIYDFNDTYHLLVSAGRGFQNASTTNAFSYYLGLQCTF